MKTDKVTPSERPICGQTCGCRSPRECTFTDHGYVKNPDTEPSESGERKTALQIVGEIFYSPATNGQAESSIINGVALVESYASQETALAIQPLLERIKILEAQNEKMKMENLRLRNDLVNLLPPLKDKGE